MEAGVINATTLGIIVSLLQTDTTNNREQHLLEGIKTAIQYTNAGGTLNHTSVVQTVTILMTITSKPNREAEDVQNSCLDLVVTSFAAPSLTSQFSALYPGPFVPEIVRNVLEAIQESDFPDSTRSQLKRVLHRMYFSFVWLRPYIRKLLYSAFKRLHQEETWQHLEPIRSVDPQAFAPPRTDPPWLSKDKTATTIKLYLPEFEQRNFVGIPELLEVTVAIIKGLSQPLSPEYSEKMLNSLLPLQGVSGMIDETTPVISLYHSQLCDCFLQLAKKEPSLNRLLIGSVISMYPQLNDKQALPFYSLLEMLLAHLPSDQFQHMGIPIIKFLAKKGISNLNYIIALRATMILRNENILHLMAQFSEMVFPIIIPALISMGQTMFSNSCREMAHLTLLKLSEINPDIRDIPGFKELDLHFSQISDHNHKMEQQKYHRMALKKTSVRLLDFGFGKTLGEGSYSIVKHAYFFDASVDQRFYEEYAIKIMDNDHLLAQRYQAQAQAEMEALQSLNHPALVNLIASFQAENKVYLVLEYVSGGDLFNLLSLKGSLDVPSAATIIWQLTSALQYVHDSGWLHLDIKPENVLITRDGKVKLTDFGSVRRLKDGTCEASSDPVGTAEYLSPEIVNRQHMGTPADVWALGILLYQILEGKVPFFAGALPELYDKILHHKIIFTPGLDFNCKDLILKMCDKDPQARFTLRQVLAHPLFEDTDFEKVVVSVTEAKQGLVTPSAIEPKLKQRKFSMLLTSVGLAQPAHQGTLLEAIPEDKAERDQRALPL
eukprot:TRINITY_DN3659_c0_g1_i1.p1 TRINITY_DN3659_c0_g1~~TRINITY_DN3659_c0_g1_i1.p1  ORF type:complete len:775 (+),score=171.00 TRINITY_DN3659_c0_g1_i1:55-2379(+)